MQQQQQAGGPVSDEVGMSWEAPSDEAPFASCGAACVWRLPVAFWTSLPAWHLCCWPLVLCEAEGDGQLEAGSLVMVWREWKKIEQDKGHGIGEERSK